MKSGWFLILIILITALLRPFSVPVQAVQPFEREDVNQYVTRYLETNGLPGASIVIVKNGEVVYEQGYGHDSEGNPITTDSLMRGGSTTKSFTAFAVLQLVDEGKVQLDEPIAAYLPDVNMDDARWPEVTVRQLLSHTSGIPNPVIVPPANDAKAGVARLHDWKLQSAPGEKYAYSNANYWLLARLVEEVGGMEFSRYMEERIFAPLGMDDSLTTVNSGDEVEGLPEGFVTAYGSAIPWPGLEQMLMGSGGLITTASDMGKWLAMQTNGGKSEPGEVLLSKELLEASYAPQPGSKTYGLGWQLSSPKMQPARVSHSGGESMYEAQHAIVPESGYAVAVLLNSYTSTFKHAYEISSGIIQLTEGERPDIKAPVPKIIDLVLGVITLLYLLLGIRGMIQSKEWTEQRKQQPHWRWILRLLPQLVPTLLTGWLFFVVPALQDNSSTIIDALGLYPAAMFLLMVVFFNGLMLTGLRIYYRLAGRGSSGVNM